MLACALVSGVGDYEVTNDDGTTPPGSGDTGIVTNNGGDGSTTETPDAPPGFDGPIIPFDPDAGADGGGTRFIYASTQNEVWQLDTTTRALTKLANAQNCGLGLEELAVSRTGQMYATENNNNTLFRMTFNGGQGTCVSVRGNSTFPFALTFAPPGVFGVDETLVGYDQNSNYIRVDPATGIMNVVKPNALKDNHKPSGDLAAGRAGGGAKIGYLSARDGNCKPRDCLLEIDLQSGDEKTTLGMFPEERILGLAYANGLVYGFSEGSTIYIVQPQPFQMIGTIDPPNGQPHWRGATAIEQSSY
jgi:hypothetical protein